jgi:hypothetical protein
MAAKTPPYQTALKRAGVTFAAMVTVGSLLDTFSNALSIITPPITYIGSVFLAVLWGVTSWFLARKGLRWVVAGQMIVLRRLGPIHLASVLGVLFVLWLPRLVGGWMAPEPRGVLTVDIYPPVRDSNREYRRLLLASAQELRSNRDCLDKYRLYLNDAAAHSPVCTIALDHTQKLFVDHHSQVIAHSYGEQKYLFQEVLQLNAASRLLPMPISRASLAQWNKTHEMTVDDMAFISGFLFWYLVGLASTELDEREYSSLGWFAASPQFVPASEARNLHMRRYLSDGEPITDYLDYLGLID